MDMCTIEKGFPGTFVFPYLLLQIELETLVIMTLPIITISILPKKLDSQKKSGHNTSVL